MMDMTLDMLPNLPIIPPLLLAGGGGNTIKTGRQVEYRRPTSMSKMHLSVLQRLGVNADRFGETDDPMAELDG